MTNNRLNIGIFISHLDNEYVIEVCKGAEYAAKELDVNLVVFPGMFLSASFNDPENAIYDYQFNAAFYYAQKENLDALIVSVGTIASFLSQKSIDDFLKNFNDIPILTLESKVAGYPCLQTDSTVGLRAAIEHLITEHKRKHICFVAGRKSNEDAIERLNVYRTTLRAHNMAVTDDMIVYGDYSEFSREIVAELLDKNPDADAIIFSNDQMAIGGYQELNSRNIRIGTDISIIGFDNSPGSVTMVPPLTTVNANTAALGYQAVCKVVNQIKSKDAQSSVLDSHFVRRLSCGCSFHDNIDFPFIRKTTSVDKLLEIFDDIILGDIKNNFYGEFVLDQINDIWKDILSIAILPETNPYPKQQIIDKLTRFLSSPVTNFFSVTNISYAFRYFSSIVTAYMENPDKKSEYYRLNSHITSAIAQFLSTSLYQERRENKTVTWSSIYITRDTLTYGADTAKTFSSILSKLKDLGFDASYLYAYDEPVSIQPDGSWKIPDSLMLQAFYNANNTVVLTGESRRIASADIYDNEYTFYDGRFTAVVVPIFTNEQHHGLFVCNTDINNFGSIYTTSLHLGASFKYLSLLNEQLQTKEQLVMSLNEIHEKNELLNHLSTSDELTGVNNRRGLMEKVEYLINKPSNKGRKAMLLFADMDSLKIVNDKFGHNDGDFALKNIANILLSSFRPTDIVGRIGGDEFICFAFLDEPDFAATVQERIQELSNELNATSGKPYYIEMSVGFSEFECEAGAKIEDLMSQADSALYTNKRYKRLSVLK